MKKTVLLVDIKKGKFMFCVYMIDEKQSRNKFCNLQCSSFHYKRIQQSMWTVSE